ncbi:glycerophosphodiester phosphodiesterase family protein [Ciceribacter sp. RN22]|uniref:glycerophosphodiester phosphodiesterase family protein n=1 Tax=Ciceribacter sp. RN22 TaxID=2954932 RepID=UPI00209296D8|nr:glycerophosphodiester phosphodiesterase family protein [Ciceribacter sp. RN22]MCO6176619.1 glycerophosphodiester phosphodiesterase family protein [Ciceribacter sp. RN22]
MRRLAPMLAAVLLVAPTIATDASMPAGGRSSQIRERLSDANRWRDHVMVVAHRAGWKESGQTMRPENSKAAIDNSVSLGVELVELDVRRSRDGALVVMHDPTLERTTTCVGAVSDHTLEELRRCRLKVEASGAVSAEPVPTFEEMLTHARGRILVNVDNKLEPEDLPDIVAVARRLGMADGIVVKAPIWNEERLARTKAVLDRIGGDVLFMPILADDAVRDASFIEKVDRQVAAPAAELVVWHKDGTPGPTSDGGPLFSAQARAVAIRNNTHLWINTYPITDRPEGMVAGGRGDGLAMSSGRPDDVYGFWIDRGVTVIQTDEPKALIGWLERQGLRRPYSTGS